MEDLIEVIMENRDDDGLPPINIQIDVDQQKVLEQIICDPAQLKELQSTEQQAQDIMDAELDNPCIEELKRLCTDSQRDKRPELFPTDLWTFVADSQKPLVAERMQQFDQTSLKTNIENLIAKININKARPHCYQYYLAQAVANLDRYILIDDNNPPMVRDKFTFAIDLKEGAVAEKCKPQTFTEVQKRFLNAKTHLLQMTDKIELRSTKLNPEDWNSRLMLVEYKERVAASRTKWTEQGLDFLHEASKAANYQEVSTWFRLTLDLRTVNAATIPEPFPMPSTTIAKENCKESRFFCVSDLADAFFSVKLRPDDYGKTGFTTHDSQFVFKVMPQGAMNAARQFSRIATAAFEGVPLSVICPFQDDTLNHAKTLLLSLENQQLLYDCTRKENLILKLSKTTLGYSSAKFLGHIHSQHGRSPDPALVSAVLDIATPTETTHVRQLLGLVQYNMEYIRGGMGILSCLSDLTLKGVNVKEAWNPDTHGVAFEEIKRALTTAPCLIPIDPRGKFTIHVDTCKTERGIGAVLLQWVESVKCWRPCAYYSRKLIKGQKQWSATELEAMGMVFACIHWDKFIRNGLQFRVVVDHKALLWLVTRKTKTANGRIISWILQLQDYDFEILHRNGTDHLDADAISRLLHFEDIKGTYDIAQELDVDDLTGPATENDLRHIVQLFKLQQFMKQRSLDLLAQEVASPPDLTEPEDLEVQSVRMEDTFQDKHKSLINSVIYSQPEEIQGTAESQSSIDTLDEDALRTLCSITNDGNESVWIEEEYHTSRIPTPTSGTLGIKVNSGKMAVPDSMDSPEAKEPLEQYPINIPLYQSKAKTSKPSIYNTVLREAQDSFNNRRLRAWEQDHPGKALTKTDRDNEDIIDELTAQYRHLEGQCFIDPRNQRMYEVIMITYNEDLQVIAAFRQVTDNEPPDLSDNELVLVEGTHGLNALVMEFTATGGNQGDTQEPWPTTEEMMRTSQLKDPDCTQILNRLTEENNWTITISHDIYSDNQGQGSLRRKSAVKNLTQRKLVIPKHLRHHIMQFHHKSIGHPGAGRMTDTISLHYWWKNYREDIKDHVSQCRFCLRRKPSNGGSIPIQEYTGPDYPFERTHMDLTGPFPKTTAGNQYILVVKCALTRYAEIIALPNKEARTVAQALVKEVYFRHGSIATLISDRGTEFTNELMRSVALLLKTTRISTTPANPRSNGVAENHMRTLKDSLASFCNAKQDDWDLWIGVVAYGYTTTVNSATGYTPFFMLYGREALNPSQEWVQDIAKVTSTDQYVTDLIDRLQYVWTTVGDGKPRQVQIMNTNQHPRSHNVQLQYTVGDLCFLKRVPKRNYIDWKENIKYKISSKLQTRYTGPYKILRQLSPVLYVANVDGKEKTIHAINMKRTPNIRQVSQANVDAARRIDINRIHGQRTGTAEDRIQPALSLPEETQRRNNIAALTRVRKQNPQEKTENRVVNRQRRERQRNRDIERYRQENIYKSILTPNTTTAAKTPSGPTQEILVPLSSFFNHKPDKTGHKKKECIMLTKAQTSQEVTPHKNTRVVKDKKKHEEKPQASKPILQQQDEPQDRKNEREPHNQEKTKSKGLKKQTTQTLQNQKTTREDIKAKSKNPSNSMKAPVVEGTNKAEGAITRARERQLSRK
jgi:hypothetical protein